MTILHRLVCAKVIAFDPRSNPGGQLPPRVKGGTGLRPGCLARPPQRGSPLSWPGSFRKPLGGPWEATLPLRPGWRSQTQSACRPGLILWREVKTQHKWARTPGHQARGWRCGHCWGGGGGHRDSTPSPAPQVGCSGAGGAARLRIRNQKLRAIAGCTQLRWPTVRVTHSPSHTKAVSPAQPAPVTKLTRREPLKEGGGALGDRDNGRPCRPS